MHMQPDVFIFVKSLQMILFILTDLLTPNLCAQSLCTGQLYDV